MVSGLGMLAKDRPCSGTSNWCCIGLISGEFEGREAFFVLLSSFCDALGCICPPRRVCLDCKTVFVGGTC